jgi:hypothetical protein
MICTEGFAAPTVGDGGDAGGSAGFAVRPVDNLMAEFGAPWAGSRRACFKSTTSKSRRRSGGQAPAYLPCNRGHRRACVIEKNLAMSRLGQYHCLNCGGDPGMGIAT